MVTRQRRQAKTGHVCQFLVVLPKSDPLVWRRIQVPESYSFWDLHVAIQDAMGWKDYHLHEFLAVDSKTGQQVRIGLPGDEASDERPCLPGWQVPVAGYLTDGAEPARYRYDFGDDWEHTVDFEDRLPADGQPYPRCVAGAGACPPEDVGGAHGYAEFLRAIRDPHHPEHRSLLEWAGGTFDPYSFDPRTVTFDDPRKRWERAFEGLRRTGAPS